jgi:lysozyme
MDRSILLKRLRIHEGMKLKPYMDSVGKSTIGIGRNLDDVGISPSEAEAMCINDIDRVEHDLDRNAPWWRTLDETRQQVIAEMCFNLGWPRLAQFKNMLAALKAGDFERAADEAMASRWAAQVKGRADTLSNAMRAGSFANLEA